MWTKIPLETNHFGIVVFLMGHLIRPKYYATFILARLHCRCKERPLFQAVLNPLSTQLCPDLLVCWFRSRQGKITIFSKPSKCTSGLNILLYADETIWRSGLSTSQSR